MVGINNALVPFEFSLASVYRLDDITNDSIVFGKSLMEQKL